MTASVEQGPERRARITAELRAKTGIDEPMIERLVHRFYDKIRLDPVLGPIFDARISDWPTHLGRMCAFWSSVALMTGRYHGSPMQVHSRLPIEPSHFAQWLTLFRETARAECPPVAAEHFIERAERIAESLQLGIAAQKGALPFRPPEVKEAAGR